MVSWVHGYDIESTGNKAKIDKWEYTKPEASTNQMKINRVKKQAGTKLYKVFISKNNEDSYSREKKKPTNLKPNNSIKIGQGLE